MLGEKGVGFSAIILLMILLIPYALPVTIAVGDEQGSSTLQQGENGAYNQTMALQRFIDKIRERIEILSAKGLNLSQTQLLLEEAEEKLNEGNITGARWLAIQAIRSMALSVAREREAAGLQFAQTASKRLLTMIDALRVRVNNTNILSQSQKQSIIGMLDEAKILLKQGNFRGALEKIRQAMKIYNSIVMTHKAHGIMQILRARMIGLSRLFNETNFTGAPMPPSQLMKALTEKNGRPHSIAEMVREYKGLRTALHMREYFMKNVMGELASAGLNKTAITNWHYRGHGPMKRIHEHYGVSPFIASRIMASQAMTFLKTMSWGSNLVSKLVGMDNDILNLIDDAEQAYYMLLNGTEYETAMKSLNETRIKAQSLFDEINEINVRGPLARAKALMLVSLRSLIVGIDKIETGFHRIVERGMIVIKGVVVDVESNSSFTVWGIPYGVSRSVFRGGRLWMPVSPTPLTWHVVLGDNATVKGSLREYAPVIVIGHPLITAGSWNHIVAEKVLVYPFTVEFVPRA